MSIWDSVVDTDDALHDKWRRRIGDRSARRRWYLNATTGSELGLGLGLVQNDLHHDFGSGNERVAGRAVGPALGDIVVHTPLWCWFAIGTLILSLLAVDFAFHRRDREISLHRVLLASAAWIGVSILFGLLVGVIGNWESAGEYFGGYLSEKALSIDNIFVFALLFRAFDVPSSYQRRVLFYGVFGALVLRGALIATGASLLDHFGWILFALGGLLILAGSRMARGNPLIDPDRNFALRGLRRLLPVTPDYVGSHFITRINGNIVATPLLVALLAIEVTDLVFAMDSIPASFGITRNAFIVFTANAFAVLGLRALYFVLVGAIDRFTYLKYGLAALLVFIGLKMLFAPVLALPILVSLAVIAAIIGISIAISLWDDPRASGRPDGERDNRSRQTERFPAVVGED